MQRIIRTKLMFPTSAGYIPRPRLTDTSSPPPHTLLLQAPFGAGKTTFLVQWLSAAGPPFVYYRLDQSDRESGAALVAHLRVAFARVWPDWALADELIAPEDFVAELVGEAAARPPVILAFDGLEAAFGQPWLADILTLLFRYAPLGGVLVEIRRLPTGPAVLAPL